MRIEPLNFRGMGADAGANLLSEWRVGAIVQAVALRDAAQQQLWLQIGAQRHPARIASGDPAGPRHGEILQLRVLRNSPVLALETLPSSAANDTNFLADALRTYLPRQESPALLLANLAWLAQARGDVESLPREVAMAAANLWQALPEAARLGDPAVLRDALARSGMFLEANLAGGAGVTPKDDLKALLLWLLRSLQHQDARAAAARPGAAAHTPLPSSSGPLAFLPAAPASLALFDAPAAQLNELARHAQGALARLVSIQIANCTSDSPTQPILIELPVRHEDRGYVLRLRIEREGSQRTLAAESAGHIWSIEAALELGAAGGLHAKVTLGNQGVGVQLRAESPGIVAALAARRGELEAALRDAGLHIDRIVCLHGLPAGDGRAATVRLVDVQA